MIPCDFLPYKIRVGIGGQLDPRQPPVEARLLTAYTGLTRFQSTGWTDIRPKNWVLDYINHGHQRQRIGREPAFLRRSGIAALYAPAIDYHELCRAGESLDESYIVFRVQGDIAHNLHSLVGRPGWCHLHDPQGLLGRLLRRIGETVFSRTANFSLLAHGYFCELLALVTAAERIEPRLFRVRPAGDAPGKPGDLRARTEHLIRSRITEPWRVADLARHLNMSASTFAHIYPDRAGESPHQTVLRLKIEAAKHLLLDNGLSVKETADRLGFASPFYFSHAFKRLEGLAPRHYRTAMSKGRPTPSG